MAAGDLTTLTKVQRYLFGADIPSEADSILSDLITSSSAWVVARLGQQVLYRTVSESRDGNSAYRMLLKQHPVVSVTSVTVDSTAIAVRPTVGDSGYVLRDDGIDLVGYSFTSGTSNVVVVYAAGCVQSVATTIPATPYQYMVEQHYYCTVSVTIAGVAATPTTGTPSAGQYAVVASTGTYTFAAADTGKAVTIVYGSIPADIMQATTEHVALRYRDRSRTGLGSQSISGESASYSDAGTLAYIEGVLDASTYRTQVLA